MIPLRIFDLLSLVGGMESPNISMTCMTYMTFPSAKCPGRYVNQCVLCVHSSYMLVAKLTHVTHTIQGICVLGGHGRSCTFVPALKRSDVIMRKTWPRSLCEMGVTVLLQENIVPSTAKC